MRHGIVVLIFLLSFNIFSKCDEQKVKNAKAALVYCENNLKSAQEAFDHCASSIPDLTITGIQFDYTSTKIDSETQEEVTETSKYECRYEYNADSERCQLKTKFRNNIRFMCPGGRYIWESVNGYVGNVLNCDHAKAYIAHEESQCD